MKRSDRKMLILWLRFGVRVITGLPSTFSTGISTGKQLWATGVFPVYSNAEAWVTSQ